MIFLRFLIRLLFSPQPAYLGGLSNDELEIELDIVEQTESEAA